MTKFKFSKRMLSIVLALLMVITTMPFTAITSFAATEDHSKEVFGYVDIDPIVYVHGTYKGTELTINNKKGEMFDYMMNGDKVADGTVPGECETKVSVKDKTISSVTVTDTTNGSVSVSSGKLTGNLGGGYGSVTPTNNLDSTVTLKFNFTDGTFEYHRLPVKANPVAAHGVNATYAKVYFAFYGDRMAETTLIATAKGSYGATTDGRGTNKSTTNNLQKEDTAEANFAYMYDPFDKNHDIDIYDSSWHQYCDSMTSAKGAFDKISGYYYGVSFNKENKFGGQTTSPTATYYLDLSSSKNYGVSHDTQTENSDYSVDVLVGNIYYSSSKSNSTITLDKWTATDKNASDIIYSSGESTLSTKTNAPSTMDMDNGTKGTVTLSGKAKSGISNFKYRIGYTSGKVRGSLQSVAEVVVPIKLIVSDKKDIRNAYNNYVSELKSGKYNPGCYTQESWINLRDKVLEIEEYLNDNTDTSTGVSASAITNAIDALVIDDSDSNKGNHKLSVSQAESSNSTCTVKGKEVKVCSACDSKYESELPLAVHSYNKFQSSVSDSENGTYKHKTVCSVCGNEQENSETACSFGTPEVINGYDVYKCTANGCNNTKSSLHNTTVTFKKADNSTTDVSIPYGTTKSDVLNNYAPTNTATTSKDDQKHNVYSWNVTDNTIPAENVTYTETFESQDHKADANAWAKDEENSTETLLVEKAACRDCGYIMTRSTVISNNEYTVTYFDEKGVQIGQETVRENGYPKGMGEAPNCIDKEDSPKGHYHFKWQDENENLYDDVVNIPVTKDTEYHVYTYFVEHSYGEWQTLTKETCTTDRDEIRYCTVDDDLNCNSSETRTVKDSATGHNWGAWTSNGYTNELAGHIRTCTNDSTHTESAKCKFVITSNTPANCVSQGEIVYVCQSGLMDDDSVTDGCGATFTEYPPATGHSPQAAVKEAGDGGQIIVANCTTNADYYSVVYCSNANCPNENHIISRDHVTTPAFGHSYDTTKVEVSCTNDGYWTSKCSVCGNDTGALTRIDVTQYGKNPLPEPMVVGTARTQTWLFETDNGMTVKKLYLTYRAYSSNSNSNMTIRENGNPSQDTNNSTYGKKVKELSGKCNVEETIELTGDGFEIWWNNKFNTGNYIQVVKVEAELEVTPATGHKIKYENGVYSCANCGDVIHTQSDKFRITKGNLFDFDEFTKTKSANTQLTTGNGSVGSATYDTVDDTAIIIGDGDTYTNYTGDGLYTIPVTEGESYTIDYDQSTFAGRLLVFAPGAGLTSDVLLDLASDTDLHINRSFTIPKGCSAIHIRYGTRKPKCYVAFSNLAIYKNDGSYAVLKDNVAKDSNILDSIDQKGATADICGWYLDSELTSKITADATLTSNLNVYPKATHTPVTDPEVELTCTQDGYTEGSHCSVCGYIITAQIKTDKPGHDMSVVVENENGVYTWYNTCSRGDVKEEIKSIDINAYDAAVAFANSEIANVAKYTEASRNALTDVVDSITLDLSATSEITQTDVENAATAVTSAAKVKANAEDEIGKLVLNKYTVDVNYYNNDGVLITSAAQQTVDYGTSLTLTLPENYSAVKWVRNIVVDGEGKELKVAETSQSITATVTTNVTYNVTVNDLTAGSTEENTVAIKLNNRAEKLVDAVYIPAGEYDVTVSKNIINIGSYKLVAPQIVFYNFGEFRIDGVPVVNGTMTFDEDTVISTVYNPTVVNKYTIETDGNCTANVTKAYWDQKVVVTAVDGNANTKWIVNGKVVGYGPTYTFRASTDVTIKCVNETEATPTATVLDLGYGSIREKTISAVCSYYVPEGWTVVETGALLKTSAVNDTSAVKDIANYTGSKANAKKFVATNVVKETNQFVINVSSSKEYTELHMGAVAYVTATKDGQTQTFYSSLATSDYTK